MAKQRQVVSTVKMVIGGGYANPTPPVGPALGQLGVNIMLFCMEFNKRTQGQYGQRLPVVISVYRDKSFSFVVKSPTTSSLLKRAAEIAKGSGEPNKTTVGTIAHWQLKEIANIKMPDLNARNLEAAMKIIAGQAKSMGIAIEA